MVMAPLDQDTDRPVSARFLRPGSSCWRLTDSARAALLVDAAAYYAALRSAILKARRRILMLGWDIDSRVCLRPVDADDDPDAPLPLGELLAYAVKRRPELEIRILLWDYSLLYAAKRQVMPTLNLGWTTPRQIEISLDDALPLGASHHQKVVVVDDLVAFCGGLDVTSRRWDTSEHLPRNPDRVDPRGAPYPPFHDVQMVADGETAWALGLLARRRWQDATGVRLPPPEMAASTQDPWPTGVEPHFTQTRLGVARTIPLFDSGHEVREVEALHLRAIAEAQRHIYIENQYLTADCVAKALCDRLAENPCLEALIVGPKEPHGWLEAKSMGAGRVRFRRCLHAAGVEDRVRIVHPFVTDGATLVPVMVHSKVTIVDDALIRVGSANLNNRSMGLDTECDLAIEAANDSERRTISALRDRLLAEHLGVAPAAVAAVRERQGSLLAVLDELGAPHRGLREVEDLDGYDDEIAEALRPIADPERPIAADQFVGSMYGAVPPRRRFGNLAKLAMAVAVLLALLLLWRTASMADLLSPARLAPFLDSLAAEPWAPLLVIGAFVAGGLVVFPVTVMIAVTAMTFGPWLGFVYALVGSLASAALTFQAGRVAGRAWLRGMMGPRVERVSRRLSRQGVLSVTVLRMVPVAPFTFVNLVAGASEIRFRDFIVGTVMGMTPGVLVMTALGDRLRHVWESPSWTQAALLALVVAVWIGLSVMLQRVLSRRRG